jgi:hypothetical protein
MKLLAKAVSYFKLQAQYFSRPRLSHFVCYKIIDCTQEQDYLLQCINTKAILQVTLEGIVSDATLLHRLHPLQACYIGIEYAKYLNASGKRFSGSSMLSKLDYTLLHRYGKYVVNYQDRQGILCFTDVKNDRKYYMEAQDIALSKSLMTEFDATQAFYIGILTGLKITDLLQQKTANKFLGRPRLRVII